VLGRSGRGLAEEQGVEADMDFIVAPSAKVWVPSAVSACPIIHNSI